VPLESCINLGYMMKREVNAMYSDSQISKVEELHTFSATFGCYAAQK